MVVPPQLIIILAAVCGFFVAFYIHSSKKKQKPMVCPLRGHCEQVTSSRYSKFFGIRLEYLGELYYGLIILSYIFIILFPNLATPTFVFSVLVLSAAAFLFSIYLTMIQLLALRQLCTWCLISAVLCTTIFALALSSSSFGFVSLLATHKMQILILHLVAVALGLGGATITDVFFFKFLRDFKISESEHEILHTLSQIIWFALGAIILTGLGLYLPQAGILNESPKFLLKMLIVGVILINGFLLNIFIHPKLVSGSFKKIRKLSFTLGAISVSSWYSAFVLALLHDLPYTFLQMFLVYALVVAVAITIGHLLNWRLSRGNVIEI